MKFIFVILLLNLMIFVQSLPIFTSISITKSMTKNFINQHNDEEDSKVLTATPTSTTSAAVSTPSIQIDICSGNKSFPISEERFAQLLSTHFQFDHLDSIRSGTYKIISEQFQKHISISIQPKSNNNHISSSPSSANHRQKSFTHKKSFSWDIMDLEILQAQIFGAIQAHTEGSLHLAWDKLADKLGQQAFEVYIKNLMLKLCSDTMNSICLKENADKVSQELDQYIKDNLLQVFHSLDSEILPQLLSTTSKDLSDVLNYFNQLFSLGENQQLYLHVVPWVQENDSNLKSKLFPLLETSILNDDHYIDFFSNYACLSRI